MEVPLHHVSVGVRGGIRTLDPRIHTTSAFAAGPQRRGPFVVWTVSSPQGWNPAMVSPVQSLHLPPYCWSKDGLARDWLGRQGVSVPRI